VLPHTHRHYAEFAGYWTSTSFLKAAKEDYDGETPLKFYDSVTGKHLFTAPVGRSMEAFLKESSSHGWRKFCWLLLFALVIVDYDSYLLDAK
jgi:hypothetical protein